MIPDKLVKCTPPLPTQKELKEFCDWEELFFTWRDKIGDKLGYCTACGKTVNLELGRIYTDEQVQNLCRKHNEYGKCPQCGHTVQWKDKNRGRKSLIQKNYLYYIQHLPYNGGVLLRTMYLRRDFSGKIKNVEIEISEHQRIYYIDGNVNRYKRQYVGDYYILNSDDYFYYPEACEWIKMSTIGMPSPNCGCGYYYSGNEFLAKSPKTYKKDDFKYFDFEAHKGYTLATDLYKYCKHPILYERLEKEGFVTLIKELGAGRVINWRAKTVPEALKLNRAEIKQLPSDATSSDIECIKLLRNFSPARKKEIVKLSKEHSAWTTNNIMRQALKYDKYKNKIIKYLTQNNYIEYFDYLDQLKQLNLPLDKGTMFPQDLHQEHQRLTEEITRRKAEKESKERQEKDREFIKKLYGKYVKDLTFASDNLLIRPAKGSQELFAESQSLHHCVYSCYSSKYLTGQTIICLIRRKDKPDEPYYTLELSKDYMWIIQCQGKSNCDKTAEIANFVDEWQKGILKRKENKKCKKTA